jgi:type III secretion protein U
MSSNQETSEEKSLPPSAKKLKDLRKKGRIARSNDMVSGATTTVVCIFLALTSGWFFEDFRASAYLLFRLDYSSFQVASDSALRTLRIFFGYYLAILLIIVVSVVVLTNLIVNRGILFSLDPMKFDLNKLNPVAGLKRIFSMRSAVELSKNLIKISLLFTLCSVAVLGGMKAMLLIPFCGLDCVAGVTKQVAYPMIGIALIIYLIGGVIDVALQNWLFRRDQRMTKTEAKRERKDEEGSPEVRTTQRRLRNLTLQSASKFTEGDATIFIEGFSTAIGIRFVRNETPLPIVVAKGRGAQASDLLYAAYGHKTAIYFDDDFAAKLAQKAEIGSTLKEEFFEPFIKALKAAGQI